MKIEVLAIAVISLSSFQAFQFQPAGSSSLQEMRDQYLQSRCNELGIEPEKCTAESILQATQSNLVIEPPCYEGKPPFMQYFNATTISSESSAFRFSLHEIETGLPVSAVSYIVHITEMQTKKIVLNEAFHAQNGTLALNVIHDSRANETRISGAYQENFLNAWVANSTEPIVVRTPEMSMDRAYNIRVSVLGAYDIRCLFPPDQIPESNFIWDGQDDGEAVIVSRFFRIEDERISTNNVTAGDTIRLSVELTSMVNRDLTITPIPIVESNLTGTPRCSDNYFPANSDRWRIDATYQDDFILPAGETLPFGINITALESGTYRLHPAFAFSTLVNGTVNETYYGRCHTIQVSQGQEMPAESRSFDTFLPIGIGAAIAAVIAFVTLKRL